MRTFGTLTLTAAAALATFTAFDVTDRVATTQAPTATEAVETAKGRDPGQVPGVDNQEPWLSAKGRDPGTVPGVDNQEPWLSA